MSPSILASASALAPGRAPDRPHVEVIATAAAPAPDGRPRVRLEVHIGRGDGRVERHGLVLPADAIAPLGRALPLVGPPNAGG
jgi:hypothetical protein